MFGICCAFVLSIRNFIAWEMFWALEGKYECFGVAKFLFLVSLTLNLRRKTNLRGMTGNNPSLPSWQERKFKKADGQIVSCGSVHTGTLAQGLVRWARPQEISKSRPWSGRGPSPEEHWALPGQLSQWWREVQALASSLGWVHEAGRGCRSPGGPQSLYAHSTASTVYSHDCPPR